MVAPSLPKFGGGLNQTRRLIEMLTGVRDADDKVRASLDEAGTELTLDHLAEVVARPLERNRQHPPRILNLRHLFLDHCAGGFSVIGRRG